MPAVQPFDIDQIARRGWAVIVVPHGEIPPAAIRPYIGARLEVVCSDYGAEPGGPWPGQYRWAPLLTLAYRFDYVPDSYLKFDVEPFRPMVFS